MIVTMEDFSKPSYNTLEEVKKLQDLVRKLEIQNQQLRNKQNKAVKKSSASGQKDGPKGQAPKGSVADKAAEEANNVGNNNNNICNAEEEILTPDKRNDNLNYFDDIEIIKVSDIDMSDDDSWLYTSPRGLTPEQKNESPYKWLRRDVDDPENRELQMAKKALITKLNDLEILSPTGQRNQHLTNKTVTNFSKPRVPSKVVSTAQERAHYSVLDTRTFTKSKKKQALEYLASPVPLETCNDTSKAECELFRRGSDVSLDSSTGTYTLADANDVQEVARMQEESLRLNSPVGTPKRQQSVTSNHSGRRMSVSSKSSVSDIETAELPSLSSQTSHDESTYRPITTTPTAIVTERVNHSDQSSPSQSPYGSNASLNNGSDERGDVYRRSLPNLTRGARVARKPSPSDKRKQKTFASKTSASGRRSDSNLHATSSKTRKEAASPPRHKLKHPSSYTSPQTPLPQQNKSKETTPSPSWNTEAAAVRPPTKSGLPRPARATSATRVWSGIPVPSLANKKYGAEDSWSDGCF